ncbi:hypothetical protein ACQ4PT_027272 [Festuca glaucescens]
MPPAHRRKVSSGEIVHKKAAAAASGGGVPAVHSGKGAAGSTGVWGDTEHCGSLEQRAADNASPEGGGGHGLECRMEKKAEAAASSGGSAALGALHGNTTAQDREGSDAKYSKKKARTVLSGGVLQKQSSMLEPDTCLGGDVLHEHLAEEVDAGKGIEESDSNNEIAHVKEEDTREQVKRLIEEMNASCIGERISSEEFLDYYKRLPRGPPLIYLGDTLEYAAMDKQEFRHKASKENMLDDHLRSLLDKPEDDCDQKFLEEEGFFRCFEKDMTLDWFIHPDYEFCSSLTDYQRLVLQNYGGTEYGRWSEYHKYLRSYKTEKEYVKYCEELSKKLKWMEDYVCTCPSWKWDYITTQAAYQAIRIAATDFHEIDLSLAYSGYNECRESMGYDATWFKEYDDLYFEIWQRVTKKSRMTFGLNNVQISFKDALEEVCKLNRFPLRQYRMEGALECDYTMMWMETEYQTCTKDIASGDTEEKARKLIAEAVQTLVNKPKSYEQYIRKKIEIARIIGILPPDEDPEE